MNPARGGTSAEGVPVVGVPAADPPPAPAGAAVRSRRVRRRPWLRRLLAAAAALALLAAAAVAWAAGAVLLAARADDADRTDAVVVLGAAQFWGSPSPVFRNRLDRAAELLAAGVAPRIVTVGGKRPGDRTTEADAGRAYLVAKGVPAADVVAVPEGADTLASLEAAAAVLAGHGWTSATLVSDPAHLARATAMARALGVDARASGTRAGDGSALTLDYVVRETGGLLLFQLVQRWSLP